MVRLFNKVYRLTIGRKSSSVIFTGDAKVITDLRISFNIEKDVSGSVSNPGTITIYNLNKDSVTSIQSDISNTSVLLEAGYTDNFDTIFEGNAIRMTSEKDGPDRKTIIYCGDGARATYDVTTSKTFKASTLVKTMIKELVKDLGEGGKIVAARLIKKIEAMENKEKSPTVLSGNSMKLLNMLLKKVGKTCSIQNNELVLQDSNGKQIGVTEDEVLLLAPYTGMIGSPIRSETGVDVKGLLQPALMMPGRLVELESESVNGIFTIKKVIFNGDTRSVNWYGEIYCE